jgi:hypothetical protein
VSAGGGAGENRPCVALFLGTRVLD